MPETVEVSIYKYNELPEKTQAKVRDSWRINGPGYDWWDSIYDDFGRICEILGVELKTRPVRLMSGKTRDEPCVYFSGFWSQGDGASFEGTWRYKKGMAREIRSYAPEPWPGFSGVDKELHDIADQLADVARRNFYRVCVRVAVRGPYCHSNTMCVEEIWRSDEGQWTETAEADVLQQLRRLADWLYKSLKAEYEYLTSDEAVAETIEANEYSFTSNGDIWP